MSKWAVVAGGPNNIVPKGFDAYAGVDAGCLFLIENYLPITLAVGDFDSVSEIEYQQIQALSNELIYAPAEKDDTDLELSLKAIFKRDKEAQVMIFGGLGGRLDHALSTIFLPSHPDLAPYMSQFSIFDGQNLVFFYPKGEVLLKPQEDYPYVAFMLEGRGNLMIEGAKYELTAANYFSRKIYGSNEFLTEPIRVQVPDGYLVVIHSKDI